MIKNKKNIYLIKMENTRNFDMKELVKLIQ